MVKCRGKISIITPVYNGEKYIKRCIESVQNQTYSNIEHIVVDDGSNDNTFNICTEFGNKIKFFHKKNEGVSKARNFALNEASGEFILFVDADDWLENNMCQLLVDNIEKTGADIVVCGYNNYYENSGMFSEILLNDDRNKNFLELITDAKSNFGGFPWNKLIRRNAIKKKFDENVHYYENLLFFLENFDKNITYSCINECLYNYCINDTSAVHSKKYNIKRISSLESLSKVIPLLPPSSVIEHKIFFVNSYFNNLYNLKREYKDKIELIKNYDKLLDEYYRDILQSNLVLKKTKIKIFLMKELNFIYVIYKRIKR